MPKCNSPCATCPEKGCGVKHSTCERYLEFKKKVEEQNKAHFDAYEKEQAWFDVKKNRVERRMKRDGKGYRV